MKTQNDFDSLLTYNTKLILALAKVDQARNNEQHLLLLLEAELRMHRLLHGLQEAGFSEVNYYTNISNVIFALMNLPTSKMENDNLFNFYMETIQKHMHIPIIEFFTSLPEIAKETYEHLKQLMKQVSSEECFDNYILNSKNLEANINL